MSAPAHAGASVAQALVPLGEIAWARPGIDWGLVVDARPALFRERGGTVEYDLRRAGRPRAVRPGGDHEWVEVHVRVGRVRVVDAGPARVAGGCSGLASETRHRGTWRCEVCSDAWTRGRAAVEPLVLLEQTHPGDWLVRDDLPEVLASRAVSWRDALAAVAARELDDACAADVLENRAPADGLAWLLERWPAASWPQVVDLRGAPACVLRAALAWLRDPARPRAVLYVYPESSRAPDVGAGWSRLLDRGGA